jgi:N-acetylneuraminic acid mutarotase
MKAQLAQRCAFYLLIVSTGTLLAFFRPEASTTTSKGTLSFAQRVGYQRAIEEIYWRHRIWPKENPNAKPPLDAVMSQAQVEAKVAADLRKSQALEDYWQRPITAEQLQAEMDRMAKHTKQPKVLREIFAVLGNDPFVIAECLARPVLSERLQLTAVEWRNEPLESWNARAQDRVSNVAAAATANYTLPAISDQPSECMDDSWTATATNNAPTARSYHTAIWTGSEMIVWGGQNNSGHLLNNGGRYNPSTDSWAPTSTTNAPAARLGHTAVWTGNEMIVWSGDELSGNNTGGRYNPSTDSWTATSTTNAPTGRGAHTAVWTGSEMIVWGGFGPVGEGFAYLNTGGRYNPDTDSWTATSTTNAPEARGGHIAVWTGSEMIVWGGNAGLFKIFNTGGRYNPDTDSWTATSTTNAPEARAFHTAVWTGGEMIVWGGNDFSMSFNTGGKYNPNTDNWTATSTSNAPTGRWGHTAVWTGSEMIVWGGDGPISEDTGGRYNPGTDSWTPTTTTNAPTARINHTAVWTGSEMIVWGGQNDTGSSVSVFGVTRSVNTGGRYCAQSAGQSPTPTPTATATATATSTPSGTPRVIPTPRARPTPPPRP